MNTIAWRRLDLPGFELAFVDLDADRLRATGSVLAADELPHRASYEVEAGPGFVTARLEVETFGHGWRRWLKLERHRDGVWSCEASAAGTVDLAPPGGDPAPLADAFDIDLAASPLFNTLPIRRLRLLEPGAEAATLVAAFVDVPSLAVQPFRQRYERLGDLRVRYQSVDSGFTADLTLDDQGLVRTYPGLAERA